MLVTIAPRIELYKLVSEPSRLRVLAACAEEELTVGELAEALSEGQPNVSRHAAQLRQAGLLTARRDGTRTLLSFDTKTLTDAVVADALQSGTALCTSDGTLRRITALVEARDTTSSAYFAQPRTSSLGSLSPDLSLAIQLMAALVPRRSLALDAGTGDGALAAALAQAFEKVIAVDRSEAQLAVARERMRSLRITNVELIAGDVAGEPVRGSIGAGADVIFASRILHHAAKPQRFLSSLRPLLAPRGRLVIFDYASHDDETMRDHGDIWLGFDAQTLARDLRHAGFQPLRSLRVPHAAALDHGAAAPDAHLPWTITVARSSRRAVPSHV